MAQNEDKVRALYRKLLSCYPREFIELVGRSMEQTFADLYHERKQQTGQRVFGLVLWTFLDTAAGVCREHLMLIFPGDRMQTIFKTVGSSGLISILLTLPLIIMEVVNRRNYNEEFPFVLFFGLWQNLFAISLILLPMALSRWTGTHALTNPVPPQRKTLLTNPKSAAMISIAIFLTFGLLTLLDSLGWVSMNTIINGPTPEVPYLPGLLINFALYWLLIAAVIIACGPIVLTLRAGGSLFAHPLNLAIVVIIVSSMVIGTSSLIIDQWPCFIGVRFCD
jgi:hypothetical protein